MMSLSIDSHTTSNGVVRLTVAGEIDLSTCDELRAAIYGSLADAGTTGLIIDLDRVTFLDSIGIRTLVQGRARAASAGITYHVTNPRSIVRRVLDVTGVLTALTTPSVGYPAGR